MEEKQIKCSRCGKATPTNEHFTDDDEYPLCKNCSDAILNTCKKERGRFYGKPKVAEKLREAMEDLGLDLEDPNLRETPQRVARLWEEFAAPSKEKEDRIKYIMSRKFPSEYKEMVICNNVKAYGICPHHFVPIEYTINFGYIPDKYVLGLSKIIDVIKNMCKSPKLQEDLGGEIIDIFMKELQPLGCICVIKGVHMCMTMRDIEARESSTITSSLAGVFKNPPTDKDPRGEFLALLALNK